REMQDEFFERHALVLDTSGDRSCAERFEEAVSVAASFASTLDTRECLLDLVFIGERPHRLTAGRGLASAVRLLEALAAAQPSPPAAFDRLARSVLAQAHEHAGAILVLLDWDEARAALVRGLRSQGVAVLAFVLVERGAQPPVRSPWLRVLEVGRVGEDLVRAVARP
ncbi:MAG: hypothetical protein IT564_11700, partial [Rhodospirillales bacterium]|nr:hypothetical protein [Rhodospirillales bacterium]